MIKKVFSVEKFKESMKSIGYSKTEINSSIAIWANKCDGLTEREMRKLGCITDDEWMIEIKDNALLIINKRL